MICNFVGISPTFLPPIHAFRFFLYNTNPSHILLHHQLWRYSEEKQFMGLKSGNFVVEFKDQFPSMVEKLGAKGFMNELYKGFELLEDRDMKGFITFESLKRNASSLGLEKMNDNELRYMVREGDVDGDGKLSEMEFYVLMFRLSPGLMEGSVRWLETVIFNEF